jgi:hypothetical protein
LRLLFIGSEASARTVSRKISPVGGNDKDKTGALRVISTERSDEKSFRKNFAQRWREVIHFPFARL